jgi:hypothetical protein
MNSSEERPLVGAMTDDNSPSTEPAYEIGDEQELLDAFKDDVQPADTQDVSGGAGRPRLNWNPVTDSGGDSRATTDDRSGFKFDLGGALARLGDGDRSAPPTPTERPESRLVASEPEREPEPEPEPAAPLRLDAVLNSVTDAPVESATDAPIDLGDENQGGLPRRNAQRPAEYVEEVVEPPPPVESYRRTRAPDSSVFDDVASNPGPSLPSETTISAPSARVDVPVDYMPALGGQGLPTLPAVAPAAIPAVVPPIDSAPSGPDLHALRSAQLRSSRQQQQGKLFGRTLLAFMVIGGLIAAATVFGRAYLFPTEWDVGLTSTVDLIQEETGVEFDHPVPLVTQSPQEYQQTILRLTIGSDWLDRVPEWRALGLTMGEPSIASVGAELAVMQPAVFDPETDTVYQAASNEPLDAALRSALQEAFIDQVGVGSQVSFAASPTTSFAGVSSTDSIVTGAIDSYLAGLLPTADASDIPLPDIATPDEGDPDAERDCQTSGVTGLAHCCCW